MNGRPYCPYKMANPTLDKPGWYCEGQDCALWNERFGMCSFAVEAYLKGQEDYDREREIVRRGG